MFSEKWFLFFIYYKEERFVLTTLHTVYEEELTCSNKFNYMDFSKIYNEYLFR